MPRMLRLALPVGLVALLVLAAAPPAQAAFHGSKWSATGVAYDAAHNAFQMTLDWSGFCLSQWHMTIKDLQTGAILEQRTFRGYEVQSGFAQSYMPEVLGGTGYSVDPFVHFSSSMLQVGTVSPGPTYTAQVVEGAYQGFSFAGVVASSWTFC
ncbi:MAG: hypothetical protein LC624_10090 [Halobacteriales archaeon]|nr:hypothetical protein [Halobacteriales archaeon]